MIDKSDIKRHLDSNHTDIITFHAENMNMGNQSHLVDIVHQCFTDLSDQWVSVAGELPKENESYFVTDGRYINIAEWSVDLECFYTDKLPVAFGDITHWREFMDPPK